MDLLASLNCPNCNGSELEVKRKVTYVYTYKLNPENIKEMASRAENLPFLFDNREKSGSDEYIKCNKCGAEYPIELEKHGSKIDFTIIRRAIRSDHADKPGFLG